jgi:hypothetical protein
LTTIALLTCDREEATRTTLRTFLQFNNPAHFRLIHADDGSETKENVNLAAKAGFVTVHAPSNRMGQFAALAALSEVPCDDEWVLVLEADQEWVRPFPKGCTSLGLECVRLQGAWKCRPGAGPRAPAGRYLLGTRKLIDWRPFAPGYEIGEAHYPGQPCVLQAHTLRDLMDGSKTVKDMALKRPLLTARVVENVTYHLGGASTPGFVA